jgi:hypothetical protein
VASVSYAEYQLTPLKQLNRFETKTRRGIILRIGGVNASYVDYHPWTELGDASIESILEDLKTDRKLPITLHLLNTANDNTSDLLCKKALQPFKNHCLISDQQWPLSGDVIKCKIGKDVESEVKWIKKILKQGSRVRLDANGVFSYEETLSFWDSFTPEEQLQIDYLEDPTFYCPKLWKDFKKHGIPLAVDRVVRPDELDPTTFDFIVHKPNIQPWQSINHLEKPVIFSSYMGHDLGRLYSLNQLVLRGDLDLIHGIDTPSLYKEQRALFTKDNGNTVLDFDNCEEVFSEIEQMEWKELCQI